MAFFSDKEFVSACMNGDRHLIDALVETYYARVFSLSVKMLEDKDEAKDICQDTFIRVLDKAAHFKFKSSLKTWILSIAYNLCVNRLNLSKSRAHMRIDMTGETAEDLTEAEETMLNEQRIEVIEKAMQLMQAEERILIEMYYLDECPVRDMALILGKSETAAKTGLFRARQKLKSLVLNTKNREYH